MSSIIDPSALSSNEPREFHDEARSVLHSLRSSLAALIASAGADPTQPQELSRRFSLDKSLTWKVARVVREDDPSLAVSHLPGRSGLQIFVRSLAKSGADRTAVETARESLVRLDEFIAEHAGDRETFKIILGHSTDEATRQHGEAQRKLAFRGQSAVWGVQSRVHIAAQIVAPSTNPLKLDIALLSGLIDFKRLRTDVAWSMARVRNYIGDGTTNASTLLEALDTRRETGEVPLLLDLCTEPTPPMRMIPGEGETYRIELTEGPVGKSGVISCVAGWFYRGANSIYKTKDDLYGEHLVHVSTPTELLVFDLYVHKDFAFAHHPTISVYSNLPGGQTFSPAHRDKALLPVGEQVTELGSCPPSTMVPEVPRYSRAISSAFERLGWTDADFHGYRFRIKYPPVPSLALFRYPLADRP